MQKLLIKLVVTPPNVTIHQRLMYCNNWWRNKEWLQSFSFNHDWRHFKRIMSLGLNFLWVWVNFHFWKNWSHGHSAGLECHMWPPGPQVGHPCAGWTKAASLFTPHLSKTNKYKTTLFECQVFTFSTDVQTLTVSSL